MRNQFLNNASGRVVHWLSTLYNHTEMQELRADLPGFLNVATGNWLLNGREDKKISVAGMLPYTTLATVGFILAAGVAGGGLAFPLLFFALAHPALGYANALNEIRKEKGVHLPSLSVGTALSEKFKTAWDKAAGNSLLTARGLDGVAFKTLSPYAGAVSAGFAVGAFPFAGVLGAGFLSAVIFGGSVVAMARGYAHLQSFIQDQRSPPVAPPPAP